MPLDIDEVIRRVKAAHPEVEVSRMVKFHPADDDHLWWFRLPTHRKDVHIESASEGCPFWMEHSDITSGAEAVVANTIDEAARFVCDYLTELRISDPS